MKSKMILREFTLTLILCTFVAFGNANELLTPAERIWLQEYKHQLTVAPNPNYPPVAFVKDGTFQGITADYLDLIEDKLGIQFKQVHLDTWNDMLLAARRGEIDLIGAIQETEERKSYLAFTSPYLKVPNAIVVRNDSPLDSEVLGKPAINVAIVKGYATHRFMQENYPHINVIPVVDNPAGLKMVAFGEADAMITDLAVASYLIQQLGINTLKVSGYIDFTWQLSFATQKNKPILNGIMQKALDSISSHEREEIRNKWIQLSMVRGTPDKSYQLALLWIIVGTAFVLAAALIWNRTLKIKVDQSTSALASELNERILAEKALSESEHKYRQLVDDSPDLLYRTDNEGKISYVSASVQKLSGFTPEEAIGMRMAEEIYLIPEQRKSFIARLLKEGEIRNFEAQLIRKDGSIWWGSANAHLLFDRKRQVIGVEGVVRDITDLKHSQEALAESEARFHSVLEQVDDVVWIANKSGQITYISSACESVYGRSQQSFMDNPNLWREVIYADDLAEVIEGSKALMVDGFMRQQYRIIHTDGSTRWIDDRKYIVFDEDRQMMRMGGIARDITERKLAEKALRRAQKMDAVGQLTGGIAHDFNNILGIILGNITLLKPVLSEQPEVIKRIEVIENSANRAAKLTRQLLGFSRRQATQVVSSNLNHLVHELDGLVSRALTPAITLEHELSDELWTTEIDPGDFQDALLNLVINARDAMPDGGALTLRTRNITLTNRDAAILTDVKPGDYIEFSISDSGTGIDPDDFDRIFEPFYTTKPLGKGTGLGLAMVFGFVNRSNGHIRVLSTKGAGTTFEILLPKSLSATAQETTESSPSHLPQGKELILAVDDEIELLELARISLESLGYRVLTALDAKKALEILRAEPEISLIFTDILMPGGLDGYELSKQALAINPYLEVLLTTGYTEKKDEETDFESSNYMILNKPYSQVELAQQIRALLEPA